MQAENITLFFQQGSSDKIYKASLEEVDGKFIVNFAYGRRGSTLKTGTKTQSPVEYEKAKKIYDKLVNGKASKGYVPDENDNSNDYVYANEQRKTGIHCQLLNPIIETDLDELFESEDWWAQEKQDGKRMLIHKLEETTAINRKGLSVGAPKPMIDSANAIKKTFLVDGEAVGEKLFAFDLLEFDGEDIRDKPYTERLDLLENLGFKGAIKVVKTAKTQKAKKALYKKLQKESAEGIVFKNHTANFTPGRPNSGGNQLKFKFYDTASVIVSKVNDKRSVAMMVYDGENEVAIGNVTIAVNQEIPKAGSIIEVRYLYAYKGGSLYQPNFLNLRDDIEAKECTIDQLKYKKDT